MAADANRLAAALAYEDERKRRLAETIPALTGPTTAPRRSVRTDLENLSAGLGQGITTQLEGIKGLITDPVGTAKGAYEAARAVVRDPSVLAAALSQMGQKAMSGPLGAGEVIGEMLGPTRGKTPVANWNADKTVPASSIVELHGVRDKKKRDALQADMELRGWSGRPVLAYRDDSGAVFALTGSHRIAAARAADIDVPIVLVSDASMQHTDEIGRYLPEIAGKDDDDVLQFLENAGDKRSAELMRLEVRSNNENNVMETRNFAEFPGEEKKVRILERDGQKAPPQKIAQALEAAPSAFEQRLRELYGDFAQAYNLGLPDTPEYRRIVQEVTAQGQLSDDALREAVRSHPAYAQAGGKAAATELRQSKRSGAAALVDSLSEQGIKTRVETSKSPGSRSTYIYASRGDKTVKIRLSDHLPAESGRVYGTNDIMTTPQHWKAAAKRALKLLEEDK